MRFRLRVRKRQQISEKDGVGFFRPLQCLRAFGFIFNPPQIDDQEGLKHRGAPMQVNVWGYVGSC